MIKYLVAYEAQYPGGKILRNWTIINAKCIEELKRQFSLLLISTHTYKQVIALVCEENDIYVKEVDKRIP